MKTYLILVKHSLPEIVEGMPAREWKLSPTGRIRAQELAERLSEFQPQMIVSSSEPKAKETAEIVAGRYNLQLQIADGLHEHGRSKTPYRFRDEFQSAIREFFEKPDVLVFGSETANESHARFYQAIYLIINSNRNKTIVAVAHGTVISLFVSRLIRISGFVLWKELGLPSFVIIDMESNRLITRENIN